MKNITVALSLILLFLFFGMETGCKKSVLKTEAVSGVVTYNGEPLANAQVNFSPVSGSEGTPSYGKTNEKGEYKLQALLGNPDAGTTPGKYQVSISCIEMVSTGKTSISSEGEEKEIMEPKSLIPKYYENFDKSGLTAEVVKGENVFNFDLQD